MMAWSDCAKASRLALFYVEFDPYGAGDAGICAEEDCTIPADFFIKDVTYLAEYYPERLIEELEEMKTQCEEGDENWRKIEDFVAWLSHKG